MKFAEHLVALLIGGTIAMTLPSTNATSAAPAPPDGAVASDAIKPFRVHFSDEELGIHTNMPATVPDDINAAALAGAPAPESLSADEKHAYEQRAYFYKHGLGYANEMANRPQTLYGIGDSPVGMAAWMLDHDARSLALISRVFFPEELYQAPRSWTESAYPKLVFYNRHEKGGHFAAWEQPDLLVSDLRAAFKSLR